MTLTLLLSTLALAETQPGPGVALAAMHQALGGSSVDSVQTVQMQVESEHWDYGQARDWGEDPAHIGTSRTLLTHGFEGGMHLLLEPRPVYPAEWKWSFEETYAAGRACGSRVGRDEFGGKARAAVPAGRIGYRTKLATLTSVWLLDRTVLQQITDWRVGEDSPDLHGTWQGAPITLVLDDQSNLPRSVTVLEDNALMGDVSYTVRYDDWANVGPGSLPKTLTHEVAGHVVQRDRISEVRLDEPATFSVADKHCDGIRAEEVRLGHHRARFLADFTLKGFLKDHDLYDHQVVWEQVAAGVFMARGPLYGSMVVDLGDQVVVAELPFSPERSAALLDLVAEKIPGKPVSYVVNSHLHHDHFGGLRAAVARGIPVVLAPNKVEALMRFSGAPKTLVPDEQMASSAQPIPVPVDGASWTLQGPERSVVVYKVHTGHGGDMLMTFEPASGTLFVADLFSPGIPPTRGLGGAIGRLAIGALFPLSKETFTSWARQLATALGETRIEPEQYIGGHGAYVGRPRDVEVLLRWGR
jgi:glyoxylase-like metal-dependent hydrolase (beta-lactamase superfamily II)